MGQAVTILSPHLDDAVLSCWRVLAGPAEVEVVNIFTGVPPAGVSGWWDRDTGREDSPDLMLERIEEDAQALALAGRAPTNLGFLDKQYREDTQPLAALVDALEAVVARDSTILAPAGFGDHVDHLLARAAALTLRRAGFAVGLYADLPHAMAERNGRPPGLGTLVDPGSADVARLSRDELGAKIYAVCAYVTQVPALERYFGPRISNGDALGYEITWGLSARALAG